MLRGCYIFLSKSRLQSTVAHLFSKADMRTFPIFLAVVQLVYMHRWKSNLVGADEDFESDNTSVAFKKELADQQSSRRPNIVLFLTDDQDVELGSLNFMKETSEIFRKNGAEIKHAYATTPMCCPSRSSLLTGLYVHNHNVYTNNDNCSSFQWQRVHEPKSFAAYLAHSGYHTGYFGKYLNKYNGSYIPPGWCEWGGLISNSKYYNYSINFNGKKIRHGDDYTDDYYTDLIANDTVKFLHRWKESHWEKPMLVVVSFPAPHGPEDSAPQHSHKFFNVTTHHTATYNLAPNFDKEWILRVTGPMQTIHKDFTNLLMTRRLQTLQSVDDAVKIIFNVLNLMNELENTYLLYTSDHGYHLGQFGLVKGKALPFEFDVRIPFLARGPGIQPGTIVSEIALNIDIAPTLLDIAGIHIPHHMDGKSLLKLLHKGRKNGHKNNSRIQDTFLIESSGRRPFNHHRAKDSSDILDFHEHRGGKRVKKGGHMSKGERLALECSRLDYKAPCKFGQKWQCILDHNSRWRKYKCRFPFHSYLRKCTCITEEGVIYTRFQADDVSGRSNFQKRRRKGDKYSPAAVNYFRFNKTTDELVNELAKTWRVLKRHRRHLNSLIANASESVVKVNYESNWNHHNGTCILPDKRQKTSQESLQFQISKLQNKLDKLKEIQRNLQENQASFYEERRKFVNESSKSGGRKHRHKNHSFPLKRQDDNGRNDFLPDTCYCVPHITPNEIKRENKKYEMVGIKLSSRVKKRVRKKESDKKCHFEGMNCFHHDNNHWQTPPYWSDPYQQNNTYSSLNIHEKSFLKGTLEKLLKCKGYEQCSLSELPPSEIMSQHFNRARNA